MSSTDKTLNLRLNKWESTDIPKMADFNADNEIIDEIIASHVADGVSHVSSSERSRWNSPVYMGSYFGDGTTKRTIKTNCPFTPSFGFVFAINSPTATTRFDSKLVHHYFAFIASRGSTIGASLSGKDITVTNYATPEIDNEFATMNATTMTYVYALFR